MRNNYQGNYFGKYRILTEGYSGADFSRRCFIFPGQGGVFPGMFRDEYLNFKIIRDKFVQADLLAKKFKLPKISDYILRPEKIKKELLPATGNLALFTLELAIFEILESLKIFPRIVTGHSFGEYAALTAAGTLSFEDMFEVVYCRENFCPPANAAGFMIAVNADAKRIKSMLGSEEYHISNMNSPQQTAISVSADNAANISRILKEKEVRHKILLNVPQPYHSPYLNGVKKKMSDHFRRKEIRCQAPKIPVFSSVLNRLITKDNFKKEDIKNIFINQITTRVDFIGQIEQIYGPQCSSFLEIGNKKLFSVFAEDILASAGKEAKIELASDFLRKTRPADARSTEPVNSKLFSLINKTIGAITGYEIADISVEDRFQEDLGIDSIKKADILLTVLNEADIRPGEDFNTSKFESIKDVISFIEDAEKSGGAGKGAALKSPPIAKNTDFKRYIFEPVEKALNNHVSGEKAQVLFLDGKDILENKTDFLKKVGNFFKASRIKKAVPNIIIRSNGKGFALENIREAFRFFRELISLADADKFNLALISFNDQSGQSVSPYLKSIAAFLKSLKKELPGVFFKHIHFDGISEDEISTDLMLREMQEPVCEDVLYKDAKRFIFTPKPAPEGGNFELSKKSVILAIGGAKGITLSLLKGISGKYNPIVYVVGKSPAKDAIVRKNLAELKAENQSVYYESADAGNIRSLEEIFKKIKTKHNKIDLIINGAGAVRIGFLKGKTDLDMDYEFNNKVLPAFNILNLSLKYKPGRIINFSSIISKYGSAGQTIYTSANELVSGLTEEYNAKLKSFGSGAVTVHWPPWDGVGMTGDKGVLQKLREYDVSLLGAKKADELFSDDLLSRAGAPVYYLDNSDDLFYSFPLNNLENYRPLIGSLSDPFGISMAKPVFKKNFNLSDDAYLKDHAIQGASYVPAAVGIGMFLCAGNMYFKKIPVLKNIEINNPIVVKNNPVSCLLEVEGSGDTKVFSIKSNVRHFHCETGSGPEEKIPAIEPASAEKEIPASSIYSEYYFKDSLYLGPIFQSIDRALIDKGGNPFIRIDNSKLLPVLGLGYYDRLIQWIDASFQALGAVALKNNLKMIPVKVSELSVYPDAEITKYIYAVPSKTRFAGDGLEGDIILVNEKGEAILNLKGVFIKKIGEYSKSRLKTKAYRNE